MDNPVAESDFRWGGVVRLRHNEIQEIRVAGATAFYADVYVGEDAKQHVPKNPGPDATFNLGDTIPFLEDGAYFVVREGHPEEHLTVVVDTDLGPLPDMLPDTPR